MLKIYIDESGNLGTQGRYFAIGAFCTEDGKRVRNIIKRHCARCGVVEFKNRETSFEDIQRIAYKIKNILDHKTGYICVDKTKIESEQLRADNNLLFNYALSFLIKDIIRVEGNQDIQLIVDNRNQKVGLVNSLGDYLRIKAFAEWNFKHNLQVRYCDSQDDRLVQVADFVAGNVLENYKNQKSHIYRIIKPEFSLKFPNSHFGR